MLTSYHSVTPPTRPGAISISLYPPKGQGYREYKKLAPGKKWFRSATRDEYLRLFAEILMGLDPHETWDELHEIAFNHGVELGMSETDALGVEPIILCFESPGSFCHRRLVAQWFQTALGVTIEEGRYDRRSGKLITTTPWEKRPPEEPKIPQTQQQSFNFAATS